MDDKTLRREQRRVKRLRALGTTNPFCRVCGKSAWWVWFEDHHIDGHQHFEDLIFLCNDCHREAHQMLNDEYPLPRDLDPERRALIHRLQGQNALARMQIVANERTISWLLGPTKLPPVPDNDNSGEGDQ